VTRKKTNTIFVIGLITTIPLLIWAYTGLPIWSPLSGDKDARGLVIFIFHLVGILMLAVGGISKLNDRDGT
jgi:hypothetical protein